MKNLATLALLSAAGTLSATAAISDNLVAYHDFEDVVSGNGSAIANRVSGGASATIFGTSPTSGFAGNAAFNSTGADGVGNTSNRSTLIVGKAANFSHTSTDAIRVPVNTTDLWGSTPATGAGFSISAWYFAAIDPNQAASQRYFVFEDGTNTSQFDVSFGSQSAAANATTLAMWAYNNGSTGGTVQAAATVGAWHHVVHTFTYDGTNTLMSVYRDGVSTPGALNIAGFPTFTEINFGNARDGQSRGWDGMIDEVAVWSRALTTSEVQGVYNLGLQGEAVTATKFNVSLSSTPATGGIVSGSGLYNAGQQADISATPKPGYVFTSWDGTFNGQPASFSHTVSADVTAVATFGEDTADSDGDGLTNYEEIVIYQTLPNNRDTDGDEIPDGDELDITGTDPKTSDALLVSFVRNNLSPDAAGAIALAPLRIDRNPSTGAISLSLSLSGSANQTTWQDIDLTAPSASIIPAGDGWNVTFPAPSNSVNSYILKASQQ